MGFFSGRHVSCAVWFWYGYRPGFFQARGGIHSGKKGATFAKGNDGGRRTLGTIPSLGCAHEHFAFFCFWFCFFMLRTGCGIAFFAQTTQRDGCLAWVVRLFS